MKKYTIRTELKSDTLAGSGEGFGAIIDTDVVLDCVGIPYIPARRIKGCLKDSAEEVIEMFKQANITNFTASKNIIDKVFGTPLNPALINVSNLTIEQYGDNKKWFEYLMEEYPAIVTKEQSTSFFTTIRQQTSIDDDKGIAKEHSLHTVRAIKKRNIFFGDISVDNPDDEILKLLWLACINLRHIGTKRNRGFGEIECRLLNTDNQEISFAGELEGVCT